MRCSIDTTTKMKEICEHEEIEKLEGRYHYNHSIQTPDDAGDSLKSLDFLKNKQSNYKEAVEVKIASIVS